MIKVTIIEFALILEVTGPAQIIAECGEQVGWLGAVLRPSSPGHMHHLTPSLVAISSSPLMHIANFMAEGFNLSSKDVVQINRRLSSQERCYPSQNWAIEYQHDQWVDQSTYGELLGCEMPCISARGFPTLRRLTPSSEPGLEISAGVVMKLFTTTWLPGTNEPVSIHSIYRPNYELRLAGESNGVLVWHPSHCPQGSTCGFYEATRKAVHDFFGGGLTENCKYRHVIGSCSKPKASAIFELPDLTLSWYCAETPQPTQEEPSIEIGPISTEQSPSRGTSIDSDMLSISEESQEAPIPIRHPQDPMAEILKIATSRLLLEFRTAKESGSGLSVGECSSLPCFIAAVDNDDCNGHKTSRGGTQNDGSANSRAMDTTNRGTLPFSRKRPRDGDENEDAKDGRNPRKKSSKTQGPESAARSLACPFWKLDPTKHAKCFKRKLSKISYVKQHLQLVHAPEFYCQRCLDVFENEQNLEAHTSALNVACTRDGSKSLNGITYQQRGKLAFKSKVQLSESDRWFVIWDIVFPKNPRPASAYVDQSLSEDLCHFVDFFQAQGRRILSETIQSGSFPSVSAGDPCLATLLPELFSRGFDQVHENWLATRSSGAQVGTSPQQAQIETPVSSFVDSAVTVGSHATPSDTVTLPPPPPPIFPVSEEYNHFDINTQGMLFPDEFIMSSNGDFGMEDFIRESDSGDLERFLAGD